MKFEKELLADWSNAFSMLPMFGGGLEFYIGSIQNPANQHEKTKTVIDGLLADLGILPAGDMSEELLDEIGNQRVALELLSGEIPEAVLMNKSQIGEISDTIAQMNNPDLAKIQLKHVQSLLNAEDCGWHHYLNVTVGSASPVILANDVAEDRIFKDDQQLAYFFIVYGPLPALGFERLAQTLGEDVSIRILGGSPNMPLNWYFFKGNHSSHNYINDYLEALGIVEPFNGENYSSSDLDTIIDEVEAMSDYENFSKDIGSPCPQFESIVTEFNDAINELSIETPVSHKVLFGKLKKLALFSDSYAARKYYHENIALTELKTKRDELRIQESKARQKRIAEKLETIKKDGRLTDIGREIAFTLHKEYTWSAERLIDKALSLQGLPASQLNSKLNNLLSPQLVKETMEKLKPVLFPEFSTLTREQQDLYNVMLESNMAAENIMEIVQSKPADAALLTKAFTGTLTVDDLR